MFGERRVVTIMFCDVTGSTAAAEKLDPEEWAQIINPVFEYMIRPVYKYEGTVARLMGDAILAFFGAPIAHEDDPQRAILAGLEIVAGMQPFKEQIARDRGLQLDVRVGINTGLVMVGAVGSDLRMEYTALGDAINLAARLEQSAEPGSVQVGEETYQLAAPLFDWQDLGAFELKGKAEPVRTYRPLRVRPRPGTLRGLAGHQAPLVGRSQELSSLRIAMSRLARGIGGILFIVGDAGMGKSRLTREVEQRRSAQGADSPAQTEIAWHNSASLSFETNQPYALFQRLFRGLFAIGQDESASQIHARLSQALPESASQSMIASLLGVGMPDGPGLPEGESFRRELHGAVTSFWETRASTTPTVLFLDDLHWADPASGDLLVYLFELTDRLPLVLLCAMRPERETTGWQAKEAAQRDFPHRYQEMVLSPLSAQDTNNLVDGLLTIAELPASLRDEIMKKTDGNPFFIEEVVRSLIESGAVRQEVDADGIHWRAAKDILGIEIPGNLQSLLVARIDRLEADARRTLQLASVIGRSFYYRILDSINRATEMVIVGLMGQIQILTRADMIQEESRLPELEYAFRHVLTQEAAYETILLRQRKEFHLRVGEAVEHLFAERLEEFYPYLAHHFGAAKDSRALRYETRAGDAAFRIYAIAEALIHYLRALELARERSFKLGPEEEVSITHLFSRLGRCHELQSQHQQALLVYEEMAGVADQRSDRTMELAAIVAQATLLGIPTPLQDTGHARSLSDRALRLARQLGDRETETRVLWNFLLLHMYSGHMDEGIPYGEQSVELARELGLRAQLGHSLQDLSLAYMAVGELEQARQALQEAQPIWSELDDKPMLAENYTNLGYERLMAGRLEDARHNYDQGYRISRDIENEWGQVNNQVFQSQIYLARGEMDRALEILDSFTERAREVGHPGSALMLIQRSWVYSDLGATEQASEVSEQAVKDSTDFRPFQFYALAVSAAYHLRAGRLELAQARLRESARIPHQKTLLEIDMVIEQIEVEFSIAAQDYAGAQQKLEAHLDQIVRSGARYHLPAAYSLQAALYLAQERAEDGAEALLEARLAAGQIGFRSRLWRILAALARLAEAGGDPAAARAYRQEAGPIIAFISEHISEPDWRTAFHRYVDSHGLHVETQK